MQLLMTHRGARIAAQIEDRCIGYAVPV